MLACCSGAAAAGTTGTDAGSTGTGADTTCGSTGAAVLVGAAAAGDVTGVVTDGTVGATAAGATTTAAGATGTGWRVHHSASAASSKIRPKPEASALTGQALRAAAVAGSAG
jgi:hypothetical protein